MVDGNTKPTETLRDVSSGLHRRDPGRWAARNVSRMLRAVLMACVAASTAAAAPDRRAVAGAWSYDR